MCEDMIERVAEGHRESLARRYKLHRISLWNYVIRLRWVDSWETRRLDRLAGRFG